MALSRFVCVAAVSLVLNSAAAASEGTTITLMEKESCLDKMNEARNAAKLKNLKRQTQVEAYPASRTTGTPATGIWKDVCDALIENKDFKASERSGSSRIHAVFELSETAVSDDDPSNLSDTACSEAVEAWKKGFDEYKNNPPLIEQANREEPSSAKVSFVTLYNPGDEPKGHCSVATCAKQDGVRRGTETKAYGLVCSTTPNPFQEHADGKLFKEEVWNNIKEALEPPRENEQKITITDGSSCLTNLNAAREEAGLSALKEDDTLFPVANETTTSGISKSVCDTLLNGAEFKPLENDLHRKIFAVSKLNEEASAEKQRTTPSDAQCSAAVEEWRQGFKAFEANPPVDKGLQYSTASSQQVSFVTLYNPESQAKGQCSVATCKLSDAKGGVEQEKTVTGLVCTTSPTVFGNESLFTQDQWDNIKGVLSSSASVTVPSIVALATLLFAAMVP